MRIVDLFQNCLAWFIGKPIRQMFGMNTEAQKVKSKGAPKGALKGEKVAGEGPRPESKVIKEVTKKVTEKFEKIEIFLDGQGMSKVKSTTVRAATAAYAAGNAIEEMVTQMKISPVKADKLRIAHEECFLEVMKDALSDARADRSSKVPRNPFGAKWLEDDEESLQ
ncbi:hypothetical protein CEUSTIGMA_g12197.t1 [Chlamydomonas eustigma]|uniref:Uncharacterized protein n=1 Tax=Chlamydomonas eustigma TaxID=1157962 RepID=A0A250XNV4_9CHLO|nr:hypothetical protein CEUSTIGMA_g12197.t1 [Chlamydomonas eustigma]|eukprot:GAX84775.1 hypothetical protein CEUSTIGMA_g12197.t1 [Chlamydomonas eustigma]